MKRLLLATTTVLGTLAAMAQNSCATAYTVTAGTYTITLVDGTEPPTLVCTGGPTAAHAEWYRYTPAADHSLTITTDLPANVGRDTRFHVYTGGCAALACVGGDDDGGSGYLSTASLNVTQGVTYLIAFDDRWEDDGFQFRLIEEEPVEELVGFHSEPISTSGYSICVVDMNGDHLDDVVSVGANNIRIHHQQAGGGFVQTDISTTTADNTPSWSLAAGDIDGNGFNDLMYGGGGGVTFMMADATGTAFTEVSFPEYVFCQRTNMVDINNDGALDAFSCHDVDANVFYLNDGNGALTFNQGGFGPTCGNYGSVWVDYDNDGDVDLFVAKCGCDPEDILYRNNGDGTFTDVAPSLGLNDTHQSWSSAWGDYDNDGDMDVVIGSSSSGYHKVMRNNGDGTFTDVNTGSGFDLFTGQSIEWNTRDFNNDGYLDVIGAGALMMGNGDMTFTMTTIQPSNGPIGDLNNDGFLDILNGSTVHYNNGNENHWVTVNTVGTTSNVNGIGARVQVTSALGTQIREVRSGDGFEFMSSLNSHFGLGADTEIDEIVVYWPSGIVNVVHTAEVNSTVTIVEGVFEGIADEVYSPALAVFPNPVQQVLNVSAEKALGNAPVTVHEVSGKLVLTGTLQNGRLDVSGLVPGVYVLQVISEDGNLRTRFTKQ